MCRTVGPSLATYLELLTHRQNVASLSLFYRYYLSRYSSELNWFYRFCFLLLEGGLVTILIDCMIFSVTISRCNKTVYVNSFFSYTARLWNSLPISLTCDLNFKPRFRIPQLVDSLELCILQKH